MQLTNMTYEIKNEVQRTTAILNNINIFTAFTLVGLCLCSNFRTIEKLHGVSTVFVCVRVVVQYRKFQTHFA